MKYRKKPVVIEAIQFVGMESIDKMRDVWGKAFTGAVTHDDIFFYIHTLEGDMLFFYIHTLEGDMHVQKYDWVIKGVKGEFYPCKPDIFEKTYEAVGPRGVGMTDRYKGFVITLEKDIREDDAASTISAIEHIKNVVSVEPIKSAE